MNGFVTLTSSTACWHDGAQVSEGPTTHQRNWWCPACGAQRTTFPGDAAEAHFTARAARSQAPAVGAEPIGYLNPKVLGPDGKIAATGALTHSGVPVGGWTLPIYTSPQPKAAQAALSKERVTLMLLELNAAAKADSPSEMFTIIVRAVEQAHGIGEAQPPVQGKAE